MYRTEGTQCPVLFPRKGIKVSALVNNIISVQYIIPLEQDSLTSPLGIHINCMQYV